MIGRDFRYFKIISIFVFGVTTIVATPELYIPSQDNVKTIKHRSDFNEDHYQFEYYFDDGTIATEVGRFDQIHAYSRGYFRFNIQWKLYELRYENHEAGTRGVLTYLSPSGKLIEEPFSAIATESPSSTPVQLSDFHFAQFRLKPNFHMESYFPSKGDNRPPFACGFHVIGEIPSLKCQTYNKSEVLVGVTTGQARTDWINYQKKMKINVLDYENTYDASGAYIVKYVFDNGLSFCEIGRLNPDHTVSVVDGHIILDYKDLLINWNFTSDATQMNVLQINDDRRRILMPTGPHSETRYRMKFVGEDRLDSTQVFSDGANTFEVYREFTEVNGQPFIRANVKCRIEHLGEMTFDINEQHAYGHPQLFAVESYQ